MVIYFASLSISVCFAWDMYDNEICNLSEYSCVVTDKLNVYIKTDLKGLGFVGVYSIHLVQ
jgi:hypothetical protein